MVGGQQPLVFTLARHGQSAISCLGVCAFRATFAFAISSSRWIIWSKVCSICGFKAGPCQLELWALCFRTISLEKGQVRQKTMNCRGHQGPLCRVDFFCKDGCKELRFAGCRSCSWRMSLSAGSTCVSDRDGLGLCLPGSALGCFWLSIGYRYSYR